MSEAGLIFNAARHSFGKNLSNVAKGVGDIGQGLAHSAEKSFRAMAGKTREGLRHIDNVVTAGGTRGVGEAYSHAWKTRPVTTLAVTGAVVGGTGIVGANMLRAASNDNDRGIER